MTKRKSTNEVSDQWLCKKFKIQPCSVVLKACDFTASQIPNKPTATKPVSSPLRRNRQKSVTKRTKVSTNRSRHHNKSTENSQPDLVPSKNKVCKIRYMPDELFLEKLKNDLKDIPLDELSVEEIIERTPEEYQKDSDILKVAQRYIHDRLKVEADEFLLERFKRKFNNVPLAKLRVEDIVKKTPQEYQKNTNIIKVAQKYIADRLKQKAKMKNLCLIFYKYATNKKESVYEEPIDMYILVDRDICDTVVQAMIKQAIVVVEKKEYSVKDYHSVKKASICTDLYSKRGKQTANKLRSQKSIVKRRKSATHRLSHSPEKSIKDSLKDLVPIPYGAGETILVDKSISHKVKEILATSWKVTLEKSKAAYNKTSVMTKRNSAEMLPIHDEEQNAHVRQEENNSNSEGNNTIVLTTEKFSIISRSKADDESILVEGKGVDKEEENSIAEGNSGVESDKFAAVKLTSIFNSKSESQFIPIEEEEIVCLSEAEKSSNAEKSIIYENMQKILSATEEPVIISDCGFNSQNIPVEEERGVHVSEEEINKGGGAITSKERVVDISDEISDDLEKSISKEERKQGVYVSEEEEEEEISNVEKSNVENAIFAGVLVSDCILDGPSTDERVSETTQENVIFEASEKQAIISERGQSDMPYGGRSIPFAEQKSDTEMIDDITVVAKIIPSTSDVNTNSLSVPVEKKKQTVFESHEENSIEEKSNDFHTQNSIAFAADSNGDVPAENIEASIKDDMFGSWSIFDSGHMEGGSKLTKFHCARDVMDRDSTYKFSNCYGGLLVQGNIF